MTSEPVSTVEAIDAELFRAVFDSVDACIAVLDSRGVVLAVNSSWETFARTYGGGTVIQSGPGADYSALCRSVMLNGGAETAVFVTALIDMLDGKRESITVEFPSDSQKGLRWFAARASRLSGRSGSIALMFLDITERKTTEDKLVQLSAAVIQSPVSIIITDLEGNIEYVNPRFEETTGYTLGEVAGRNPRFLKSGYTAPFEYAELWRTITAGREWRGEFQNRKKDGELFWESASISPVRDAHGQIRHFLAVKENITDRKKSEAELIASKEKAERSERLKDAFISNMSHEIRTPLNVIMGYSELVMNDISDRVSEREQQYFQHIGRAGKRLMRTVDNILNFSTLQVGAFPLDRAVVDLVGLVYEIGMEMRVAAIEKAISFDFVNDCGSAMAYVDTKTLRDALSNVLDNAIKFTRRGGVTVHLSREGDHVSITIQDTGIGISDEYLPHIFRSFSQEECGYTRRFEGLGLGMALTKQYVDANGGSIDVKSRKGVGTTFRITFPEIHSPNIGNAE